MKTFDSSINTPGRMTALAMLVAGLAQTGFATAASAVPAPNHMVISQVYGGGGNNNGIYYNDFIELFNPTSAAISVDGWTVQYTSSNGSSWARTLLTGTVPAGGYYLIQEAKGANTSGQLNLPTPDVLTPSGALAMSGTEGKVVLSTQSAVYGALTTPTVNVVDAVSYGGGTILEGANAGATSNPTAVRRNDSCVDTDVNKNDFSVVTPVARNSATPLAVCGTVSPPVAAPIVPVCPATYTLAFGNSGSTALTASDADSIVNSAIISSGATAGIALGGVSASSANGGTASVNLNVGSTVPVGTYPIGITFSNDGAQTASCTVSVAIQAPAGGVTHTIPQIQGAGAKSPYVNTAQTTEGVVTRTVTTGYYIQDVNGDGDPTTSDGIHVYMGATPYTPVVGDLVRITATVSEFTPTGAARTVTELVNPTATTIRASGMSVAPTNISFSDVASGAATMARYEGMLVNITDTLTVNQGDYLGERGELTLAIGRKETASNKFRPNTPERAALTAANALNEIILDDGSSAIPLAVPYLGQDGTVRVGDTVTGVQGVVGYDAIGGGGAQFKIQPTLPPVFSRINARPDAPTFAGANIKVASANVLNFFTVFTDGKDVNGASGKTCLTGCRGADNLPEFIRQRDKIVNELKGINADVFGLMEIQNDGDVTVNYLVDQLNAAIGTVTYAVVPKPADTGTDAIRVAMIYKPSTLTLVGGPLSDGNAINNRPPFAQTFSAANGGKFSLIVNHMKSKGSCDGTAGNTDIGDGQSCFNAKRVAQATRLASYFIPQVVNAGGTPNVLVIGDLNSYGMEDPIQTLINAGLLNQIERFVRPNGMPYSYVFDGETGYLDHALASAALAPQVVGVAEWHNNADEPTAIDYNFDKKPGGTASGVQTDPSKDAYVNDAYRASDHDPVVIGLALAAPVLDITASVEQTHSGFSVNRITNKYASTITFTNTSASTINGPFQVQFDGLTPGVTVVNPTGSHNGVPYLTVGGASLAPGATVTLSVVFYNPAKGAIGYTNTIYSGSF
jgi:predicted extracellular nuclease